MHARHPSSHLNDGDTWWVRFYLLSEQLPMMLTLLTAVSVAVVFPRGIAQNCGVPAWHSSNTANESVAQHSRQQRLLRFVVEV